VLGTTTANANGVWSFTPTGLAAGLQTITASETNAAGLTVLRR
jgi:VCBS repeat-containing protein